MQASRRDFGRSPDFSLGEAKFLFSRDIWLALDDSHCDSRISRQAGSLRQEPVTIGDAELYHRQLFYWLMIRCGPCVFAQQAELYQGVPAECHGEN